MKTLVFETNKFKRHKMEARKILFSLLAIASVLFLASVASAQNLTSNTVVYTDDLLASGNPAVVAGETVVFKVYFTSDVNASDVRIRAELEGNKDDVQTVAGPFDVETGRDYKKTLTLRVPFELNDELSDTADLNVKIWNGDYKTEVSYKVRIQRPSYDASVKSVTVSSTIEAGEIVPVEFVLRNVGYNELEDVYVTARISALGVEKSGYFGDIVALENKSGDEDEDDTIAGKLLLKVPENAKAGVYTLELEVRNDETTSSVVKQVTVRNDFEGNVLVTTVSKTVKTGEDAEYSLVLLNPSAKIKVYTIVPENAAGLTVSASDSVVVVPAGSSKNIAIKARAAEAGEYKFNVNVLSADATAEKVTLTLNAEAKASVANPIVVLTIVLIIVFIVLLVVLFVLIGKRTQKSETIGESYY